MEKPDTRRKIMFYLNPESSDADRYVCDEIDRMPQGDRGRVWRAALVSGFALRKQDARLPNMLAELLNEHTTFDEMVTVMQAVFPEEMNRLENRTAAGQDRSLPVPGKEDTTMTGDETRENAQAMFGYRNPDKGN